MFEEIREKITERKDQGPLVGRKKGIRCQKLNKEDLYIKLPREGKSLGLVSIGTGGTMGHMTLVTTIARELLDKTDNEIYIFSEYNYKKFTSLRDEKLTYIKLPKQEELAWPVAGRIEYKYSDLLLDKLENLNISHTFFLQYLT